jgi:RNA polymerase sigma factor (sigma-70 family)
MSTEDGQDASPPSLQHFLEQLNAALEPRVPDLLRSAIRTTPVAAERDRLHMEAMRRLLEAIRGNEVDLTEVSLKSYYDDEAVPQTLKAIQRDYQLMVDVTADLVKRTRRTARTLVKSTDDGEELLWRSAEVFLDRVRRGKFSNWDNPGVRYKYFETILKRKAWRLVEEARRQHWLGAKDVQGPSPSSNVMWHDPTGDEASVPRLVQLLKELPQREREVLFLHFWYGLSKTEIAMTLGVARSTVHSRLSNALLRTKKLLGGATGH